MSGSPRADGEGAERSLQLEAAKWKSMVFEIEELLNGYVRLGDKLEDQAQRLADKDSDEPSVGRNELEVGQEVQVRVISVDTGMNKMSLSMKPEDAETY
mmetsp:Transcript_51680/g.118181  ORF Transcript_51680/g.118181 Transcript_51680/m.118181 type:complete len:99 (-) Transcript_51680:196-492(-)